LFGERFDLFNPNYNYVLKPNSIVLTIAALEQTGKHFKKFIKYLLLNKPKLCIHIEPIIETLDENKFIDYLSIQYFKKRRYLNGFLSYLKDKERKNILKIIKVQRTFIGSIFTDGYSVIIWKPIY